MQLWEKLLLGVAGIYIVYEVYNAINTQQLSFSLGSVGFNPTGLSANLAITVNVKNPTASSYTLQTVAVGVYVNGNFVGNLNSSVSQSVPPYTTTPVNLQMTVSDVGLIATLAAIFAGSASGITVQLSGAAQANNLTFPLNVTEKVL